MIKGRIIKGIAGFYYVNTEQGLYECKAKGVFRNQNRKPLVGDYVTIDIQDEEKMLGNISDIVDRHNELIRPASANVDQVVLVFALTKPSPNRNLIDRFLACMEHQGVETVLVINKCDHLTAKDELELQQLIHDYGELAGYKICPISAKYGESNEELAQIQQLKEMLLEKTSVFSGPSGVGKSTLLNRLVPEAAMETGGLSEKIARGKNTTRHAELFEFAQNSYLMDTPGFSSVYIDHIAYEDLELDFPEFKPFLNKCRFTGCAHIGECDCEVKKAVADGKISLKRYENYKLFYTERKEARRY